MRGAAASAAIAGKASDRQNVAPALITVRRTDRLPGSLAILVPVVAESLVGGYRIAGPSLWRDEAASISGSQRPLAGIMSLVLHQDAVHGAYYLLR